MAVLALTTDYRLSGPTGTPDEWLGRDHDVETIVYLFVQRSPTSNPRDSKWSIAWPVGGLTDHQMTAWRHIQLEVCPFLVDLEEPARYDYHGPITKTGFTLPVKRFMLVNTTLATRKRIERLACDTGAMLACSERAPQNGQEWIKQLMDSMVAVGLMPASKRDRVVEEASSV
ncbi:hypothetical protein C2E23DRAFT_407906 [Lenzites betulinus]|nr:hypothetical protein C2E23DRAFT_407906 [Lenzites betulinus]